MEFICHQYRCVGYSQLCCPLYLDGNNTIAWKSIYRNRHSRLLAVSAQTGNFTVEERIISIREIMFAYRLQKIQLVVRLFERFLGHFFPL